MPVATTPGSAKTQSQGKGGGARKARPSEDSDEEQKIDMDEENDDSNVVLVNEVKPRKKLVKRVTRDGKEGNTNGKTSSIVKTAKGDARARVKKKKVDEGKSKIKAAESDEEQQPKEEEIKTDIKSRITQETHVNEENQNHSRRVQLRFQ